MKATIIRKENHNLILMKDLPINKCGRIIKSNGLGITYIGYIVFRVSKNLIIAFTNKADSLTYWDNATEQILHEVELIENATIQIEV